MTDERKRPKQQSQSNQGRTGEKAEESGKHKADILSDQKAKDSTSSSRLERPRPTKSESEEKQAQEKFNAIRRRILEMDNLDALGF